jgi:hypothetical protein
MLVNTGITMKGKTPPEILWRRIEKFKTRRFKFV